MSDSVNASGSYPPLIDVGFDAVPIFGYTGKPLPDASKPAGYRPPAEASNTIGDGSPPSKKSALAAYRRRRQGSLGIVD